MSGAPVDAPVGAVDDVPVLALRDWMDDDRLARAAWSRIAEPLDDTASRLLAVLGPVAAVQLLARGGPAPRSLVAAMDLTSAEPLAKGLQRWRLRLPLTHPDRDVRVVERLGGRLVVPGDDEWPAGLVALGRSAPPCLWVRGPLPLSAGCAGSVAVVGARASTAYGERVALQMGAGLAERGTTVVSGAAYGIDGKAHQGALAADGATVAVLACGVDRAYPQGHDQLLRQIMRDGAVVAEVPPGSAPMRQRFLARNRLIAAMSGATVVVEAAWRSGALSTAHHAAGLGRPLGAVPGPVTSAESAGCHRLLREAAATCVTDAAEAAELVTDLATQLALPVAAPPVPAADHDGLPPEVVRVLDALPVRSGATVAALARTAGLPEGTVAAGLGRLGLRGLAQRDAGGGWRRARAGT